jgi:deoxyribodipyrimidine photo-lyase
MLTDAERIQKLNNHPMNASGRVVLYWMQSDQRAEDNWALTRTIELGNLLHLPVIVLFIVNTELGNAYLRHYDFMLKGVAETARRLRELGIGFYMFKSADTSTEISVLAASLEAAAIVTDQSYLNYGRKLRQRTAGKLSIAMEAIDANTIVPPRLLYPKAAYGAYILRPKLHKLRERFLMEPPTLRVQFPWLGECTGAINEQDVDGVLAQLNLDSSVGVVKQRSGLRAAQACLEAFIERGFRSYYQKSNDPVANTTSRLSAFLHFGQISSQRVAYEVLNSTAYDEDPVAGEGYLDELITWRETAVNNAIYNAHYRSYEGIPAWAKKSLEAHEHDPREFVYSRFELEMAKTHDDLWNAAQIEMVKTGRMHGYMRMYWAKKILEWSSNARDAITVAVYLNDKYLLDGRDPNGYAGILWAIGGLHDRPWFDREVYGQVRYMSYSGAKSKFDVPAYIRSINSV